MSRIATGLFAALALAAPGQAFAATHAERIDALIRSYNELRQFNGSALVAEKGRVILRKGYGMANMEWRIPNGPETRFRIASNTKQFTSLLIMQLVSEGRLGLDDKITKYLPAYRNAPYLDMSNLYAAGAAYSTVDDLFKWDRALYTEKLLDDEHKKVMWTPVRDDYASASS